MINLRIRQLWITTQLLKPEIQLLRAGNQHLPRLGAFLRTDNPGSFQLVHYPSGLGIAHAETPLEIRCGAFLGIDHQSRSLLETLVKLIDIKRPCPVLCLALIR